MTPKAIGPIYLTSIIAVSAKHERAHQLFAPQQHRRRLVPWGRHWRTRYYCSCTRRLLSHPPHAYPTATPRVECRRYRANLHLLLKPAQTTKDNIFVRRRIIGKGGGSASCLYGDLRSSPRNTDRSKAVRDHRGSRMRLKLQPLHTALFDGNCPMVNTHEEEAGACSLRSTAVAFGSAVGRNSSSHPCGRRVNGWARVRRTA